MAKRKSTPKKSNIANKRDSNVGKSSDANSQQDDDDQNRPKAKPNKTNSTKTKNKIEKAPYRAVLHEIKRLQKSTDFLIPKAPFLRCVREILTRDGEYRITEMAIEALRESAEAYLIGLLEDSYMLSLHAKRVTLMPTDMRLALLLRRDLFSESG